MEIIKDIKITLYDIFGYLLPGIVLFTALGIIFWTFFYWSDPVTFTKLNFEHWMLIFLLSYFLGHITQALGNTFQKIFQLNANFFISKSRKDKIPNVVIRKVKSKINQVLGEDLIKKIKHEKIRNEWLFRICDEYIVQFGIIENRELYVYREGFYRGLIISFFVFFLSLLSLCVKMLICGLSINFCDSYQSVTWLVVFIFTFISLGASYLFFLRWKRFFKRRIRHALLGFLILYGSKNADIENKKK